MHGRYVPTLYSSPLNFLPSFLSCRIFHFVRGTPLAREVTTHGLHILRRLYEIVQQRGGGASVTKKQAWVAVCEDMKLLPTAKTTIYGDNMSTTADLLTARLKLQDKVSGALRRLHENFLAPMEAWRNIPDNQDQQEMPEDHPVSSKSDESLVGKFFWRYVAKANAVFRAVVTPVCARVCCTLHNIRAWQSLLWMFGC